VATTDFLELLGLTHPIVQAPMSGIAPAPLAVAVCNTGALGSIGCAALSLTIVRRAGHDTAPGDQPPVQS